MVKTSYFIGIKLDGVAPSVTNTHRANSTPRQNPPICKPPLYIALTSEPIMQDVVIEENIL